MNSSSVLGCGIVLSVAAFVAAAPARAQDAIPAPAPAPSPSPGSPSPATAPAIPRGPRLEYSGAPGCLDEETFRHAVASYLQNGADPFDSSSPDVLRVAFKKVPGGYRGTLQKIPAKGQPWPAQETTGATCSQVFRAVARVASMRVPDPPKAAPPSAPPAPTPPAPAPPPPPEPAPTADPIQPPPDPLASQAPRVAPASFAELHFTPAPKPPPPPPPMDLTITLNTALIITAGFTADVGPALQLGAGLRRDWFSLDLEVRGVFPGRVWASAAIDPSKPTNPQAFDVSQLGAQLVPCVRFAKYFAGCGVVQAHAIIPQDRTGSEVYAGYGLGPRFAVEVPFAERFAVFGFAEVLFAPIGPRWRYSLPSAPDRDDAPNVEWALPDVSGFFGVGVSAKFQ